VWGEFRRARAFRRSEAEAVNQDSIDKKFGFCSGGTANLDAPRNFPIRAARGAREGLQHIVARAEFGKYVFMTEMVGTS